MKVIKRLSNTKEVLCCLEEFTSDQLRSINILTSYYFKGKGGSGDQRPFTLDYDYIVSAKSKTLTEHYLNGNIPENKFIKCGYIRKFHGWKKYLEKNVAKEPKINKKRYFLYLVGTTGKYSDLLNQLPGKIAIEESLKILKKYNEKLFTIFKPHPHTDVKVFKEILAKTGYKNYIIDYSHPMILSSKASFVITSGFSTCMNNSFFQGITNIEFSSYDPIMYEKYGRQSYGGRIVDFFLLEKDWEKLDDIIQKIISGEITIKREKKYIDDEFPDTPPQFWLFWEKLLDDK